MSEPTVTPAATETPAANVLLDALDGLSEARDMFELVAMAHRYSPEQDAQAVLAGLYVGIASLDKSAALLKSLPAFGKGAV